MLNLIKVLREHEGFKRYAEDIGWIFFGNLFRMLVTLFVGIWVVRYLGPEQFGLLSYVQSIALIAIAIASLGFEPVATKLIINQSYSTDEVLATSFMLKLVSMMLTLCFLCLFLFLIQIELNSALLTIIISLGGFFVSFNILSSYFQAHVLSKFTVLANAISFSLISILKIVLIVCNASITAFALTNLLEFTLIAFFMVYFYQNTSKNKISFSKFNIKIAQYLFKTSWPLIFSVSFAIILDKIDQVMIKNMLGAEALGHYVAASRLSEVWYFVGAAIVGSVFPALVNAKNQDSARYNRRLQKLFDILALLSISIALPVSIFSEEIIALVYGSAYRDSATVLAVHIWTSLFVFFKFATSNWLVMHDLQTFSLWRTLFALITNVLLNLILIPIYGILGAAVAMLLTLLIAIYLLSAILPSTRLCFQLQTYALFMRFLYKKNH